METTHGGRTLGYIQKSVEQRDLRLYEKHPKLTSHSLWDVKENVDFVITCGGKRWDVHQIIIRSSKFFNGAINSGFKVAVSVFSCAIPMLSRLPGIQLEQRRHARR